MNRSEAIESLKAQAEAMENVCKDFFGEDFKNVKEIAVIDLAALQYCIAELENSRGVEEAYWIDRTAEYEDGIYECSACHTYMLIDQTPDEGGYNFCPECGAKMCIEGPEKKSCELTKIITLQVTTVHRVNVWDMKDILNDDKNVRAYEEYVKGVLAADDVKVITNQNFTTDGRKEL